MIRNLLDLRLALILLVLVPLLVVFGGGGLLALGALERQLEDRMQEDISLIARTLKLPMSRALEREQYHAMDQALRSAFDLGRVYGVYVYDADGRLVTQADKLPGRDSPIGAWSELRQLENHQEELGDYRSMGGQDVFSLFTPLTDAGGQVIGMLQITRHVSEMRNYIKALRLRVLPVLLAISVAFIAIVIIGHNVAIGRPLRRLSHGMDRVAAGDIRLRPAPGGPREIRKLGERFNAMLDGIAERDRNLAAQREARSRLADKLRRAEKYALAGRLAAGVAHELGTPLSVVEGHVQRLLRRHPQGSDEHATLSKVRQAARQMAEVVRHLLGFGRGAAAEARLVPVSRLTALAAADVRTLFEQARTGLEVAPGPAEVAVPADESRLREALTHLLKNALYAARGGQVRLGWECVAGENVLLSVEDSGAGVAPEDRERIFEPFFTTKEPGQGSGLGLAVVRGILAEFGAEIDVAESVLGGAAFRIRFPAEALAA